MLTRIHIENFRFCQNVTIDDAGAVVALVGRNGAGKSNILQAIAQTARLATSAEATGLSELMRPGLPVTFELDFKTGAEDYRYHLGFSFDEKGSKRPTTEESLSRKDGTRLSNIVSRRSGQVLVASRKDEISIGDFTPCLPAISTLLPTTDSAVIEINPARAFLSAIRYYPLNEPTESGIENPFVPDTDYAKWASVYESTGIHNDDLMMRIIYMQQKRTDDFATLEHLVGKNGLGLIDKIVAMKLPVGAKNPQEEQFFHFVRFIPSRGSTSPVAVAYNELSLGTRRILRLLTSMLFDNNSVMLLEQPEDSLHQGLTKKLIGILRSNALPSQLIFSSHSSSLLNKLGPEEIRLVSLHNGFTQARVLTKTEVGIARKFMNEEGTLYDFLESVEED